MTTYCVYRKCTPSAPIKPEYIPRLSKRKLQQIETWSKTKKTRPILQQQQGEDIMVLRQHIVDNNIMVRKEGLSGSPYSPILISSNGRTKVISGLIDTGAHKPIISRELAKKLNLLIRPTDSRCRDAELRPLSVCGEVDL